MEPDVRPAFWAAFWSANRALVAARDTMLELHGVSSGQEAVLSRLWALDNQAPSDLARSLDLSTAAISSTAAKMEEAGLLSRDSDGHHVTLVLTKRGRDLEKILDREMRRLGERALSSLSDPDRVQLVRSLRAVRANTTGR